MRPRALAALAWLAIAAAPACSRDRAADLSAPVTTPAPVTSGNGSSMAGMPGMSGMAHGNHNPKYGGTVLMNGDMHFEVVLNRDGTYHVYFSDAARNDLPASMASNVVITVTRPGGTPEPVSLKIDDAGESWVGRGAPVKETDATARIAYSFQGKPYWIDLPFSVQDAAARAAQAAPAAAATDPAKK